MQLCLEYSSLTILVRSGIYPNLIYTNFQAVSTSRLETSPSTTIRCRFSDTINYRNPINSSMQISAGSSTASNRYRLTIGIRLANLSLLKIMLIKNFS